MVNIAKHKLTPIGSKVMVLKISSNETRGMLLDNIMNQNIVRGVICSVGLHPSHNFVVKVGDKVIFQKDMTTSEITLDGTTYYIIREEDAVIIQEE